MPKPICVPCRRFYRVHRNGTFFVEAMPIGGSRSPPPGLAAPELWEPYKLWSGDLWRCEGCGSEIIVGAGHYPISEHYRPGFTTLVEHLGAKITINDC